MPEFNQNSFAGGVISPRMQFSEQDPLYHVSLASAKDWAVSQQGSIVSRCGSEEVGLCQDGDVVLFRMPNLNPDSQDYTIEIGETEVAVWVNDLREKISNSPAEWSGKLGEIQVVFSAQGNIGGQAPYVSGALILVHPNVQPKRIAQTAVNTWAFENLHTTLNPDWGVGNYPRTVAIFQNRLWYCSSTTFRTKFWSSKPGDFETITGAETQSFVSLMEGYPLWMVASSDVLTIGNSTYSYQLTAVGGGAVTAANALLRRSSSHGSSRVQGIAAEEQVVFTSRGKNKIRAMNYVDAQNNWLTKEISKPAEHYFTHNASPLMQSVRRLVHIPDANNALWVLLDNGEMKYCCFYQEMDMAAWTSIEIHGGSVSDISSAYSPVGDYLYLAVKRRRILQGVDKEYTVMEKIPPLRGDWKRIDGWSRAAVNANGDIVDLAKFIGQEVSVITEFGKVDDLVISDENQTYTIPNFDIDTNYYVGYRFDADFTTLTPSFGSTKQTLMSKIMRPSEVKLAVNRGVLPLVEDEYPDDRDYDEEMDTRSLDLSVDTDNGLTDIISYRPRGWDNHGRVSVKLKDPFLCEITSIFMDIKANKV